METNFLMTAFSLTLFVAAVYAGGAAIDNSVKELRKAFLIGLINIILLACGICSDILPWGCVGSVRKLVRGKKMSQMPQS